MNNIQGKVEGHFIWRQERDKFIDSFSKLTQGSKQIVPDTAISYDDLAQGVAESISSNSFPEIIGAKPVAEVQQKEEEKVVEEPVVSAKKVKEPEAKQKSAKVEKEVEVEAGVTVGAEVEKDVETPGEQVET